MRYKGKTSLPPLRPPYITSNPLKCYTIIIETIAGDLLLENIRYRKILPEGLPIKAFVSEDSVMIQFMATQDEFLAISRKLKEYNITAEATTN